MATSNRASDQDQVQYACIRSMSTVHVARYSVRLLELVNYICICWLHKCVRQNPVELLSEVHDDSNPVNPGVSVEILKKIFAKFRLRSRVHRHC